jgi:hypothetical protein
MRATLLDHEGKLLIPYVAKPRESGEKWLSQILDGQSETTIVVGSPLDEWPDGMIQAVERIGHQAAWLNPSLMRRLYNVCRPWNLHRKIHRAYFLGYLHLRNAGPWDAESATRDFEIKVAVVFLSQLGIRVSNESLAAVSSSVRL